MSVEWETTRRVHEARDRHFRPLLLAFVSVKMEAHFGQDWRQKASASHGKLDVLALLKTMRDRWLEVFRDAFEGGDQEQASARDFMYGMIKARHFCAHLEENINDRDGLRFLDAMHELAGYMKGEPVEVAALKRLYDEQRMSGLKPAQTPESPARVRRLQRKRNGRRDLSDFKAFLISDYERNGTGGPLKLNSANNYCVYIRNVEKVLNLDLDQEDLTEDVVDSIIDHLRDICNSREIPTKYISDWSSGLRAYAVYRSTFPGP